MGAELSGMMPLDIGGILGSIRGGALACPFPSSPGPLPPQTFGHKVSANKGPFHELQAALLLRLLKQAPMRTVCHECLVLYQQAGLEHGQRPPFRLEAGWQETSWHPLWGNGPGEGGAGQERCRTETHPPARTWAPPRGEQKRAA